MQGKIINDPVYGFIRIHPQLISFISHPFFQRLRSIKQMGLAHFVYPGAVHTRLHHSLGAMHLMNTAIQILNTKGAGITEQTAISAQQAILLHDIGHGPFSHALEHTLVKNYSHEDFSLAIMRQMNAEMNGNLEEAIAIFTNQHPTPFLHQLVSSQLDMDRMDYLNRDSFYSGVSEGVIGYDRILEMLNVVDGNLVVEEKGIHSVEKFLIARRLMYWQVYLHKTVLGTEILLINILKRAKELAKNGATLFATPALKYFLYEYDENNADLQTVLNNYVQLDDADISAAIKVWMHHEDKILSKLCKMIMERNLFKIKMATTDLSEKYEQIKADIIKNGLMEQEAIPYFTTFGKTGNDTYTKSDQISVLYKNGEIKDITEIENALIQPQIAMPVEKQYICIVPELKNLLQ